MAAKKKVTVKKKGTKDPDIQELQRFLAALKATQHNPIEWGAVIKFAAPILARLAARYAAGYLAAKWNKRATPQIRTLVATEVANRINAALKDTILAK